MAVKKQTPPKPIRKVAKKAARKVTRKPRDATPLPKGVEIELPTERKIVSSRIEDYSVMVYSFPGWGKSTFFAQFPDVLFLSTERGTSGLPIYEVPVVEWSSMRQAIKKLQKERRFQNVVIDTGDEGYRLCLEWICKQEGIEHPTDIKDYGKTWNAIANEFCRVVREIKNTGRGCYLTAHCKQDTIEEAGGKDYTRVGPNLTGKAGERVLAMMDFIWYGDYMVDDHGNDLRVIRTRGNKYIVGKQRKVGGPGARGLPLYIALPEGEEERDYEIFAAAFRGEDVGIDPSRLRAGPQTSETGAVQVKRDRMDAQLGREGG